MILVQKQKNILNICGIAAIALFVIVAKAGLGPFPLRVFNQCGIFIILALSLNLINGFTGLFSLGHSGFMAIGAYTTALLTMSPEQKVLRFTLAPIIGPLANIQLPFIPALIIAGLVAGLFGFLIGAPVLRLRDDYLAIATLGFSEIIRVVINNLPSVTNGALGLNGLPPHATTYMIWGTAFVVTVFILAIIRSAFGRSCCAVRDNEIAAQAMGIDIARVKITSFTIASFLAGVGGALLGHQIGVIAPPMFTFVQTYEILLIVVLGGVGSITGTIVAAIVVRIAMEGLRFLDGPLNLIFIQTPALPGLRMVVFSVLLMLVVIFRQQGLMGSKEFSWEMINEVKPWFDKQRLRFTKRGR